eukprot:gb/GFBE01041552.1/.p1 GENE.gb/GFBE01041552.1/~~gb/GFBE01041552.1/.p1  ORF type:complete len:594 (+),score=149.98 gb/GFBE01041552.1/:1-1782(+)
MQLLRVGLASCCLALVQVDAAKVVSKLAVKSSRASSVCINDLENHYPAALPLEFNISQDKATAPLDSIWDTETLRAALKADEDWAIGKSWMLQAKFTSDSDVNHTFAFAGSGGGFLKITVPASVQEKVIQVNDVVSQPAERAEFQYVGPAGWTTGKIYMTDICLTPMSCDFYSCPPSSHLKAPGLFGNSYSECCVKRICKEEAVECLPASQYRKHDNYSSEDNPKLGWDLESCCVPMFCPDNLCANDTQWKDKGETGLVGSLPEECCEERFCSKYNCSDARRWKKLPIWLESGKARQGSTDQECCDPIYCSDFGCDSYAHYVPKAGAEEIMGSDRDTCCDVQNCSNFTCPNNTFWRPKEDALLGNSEEECCEKLVCSDYTCSSDRLQYLPNASGRQGSTDDECCEVKSCKDWTCSDPSMWVKRPEQTAASNTDRRGWSDEECCDKVYCLAQTCDPSTQWTPKPPLPDGKPRQGSKWEQCCDPVYCSDYVCDTDTDGDGMGTAWYKKVDTNHYKFQGSSEEECCYPIYCSQYTTTHETRWKRKADLNIQGSTDKECYDPRLCSDYCCADETLLKIPNDHLHQGSTDAECCMPRY